MREIKFRMWVEEEKTMKQVDCIYFKGAYCYSYTAFDETIGCEIGPGDRGEREIYSESANLMQFAGSIDKNGKEIYEGDIYKDDDGIYCVIEFERFIYDVWESLIIPESIEIVGNVHENPELLEATK